MRIAKVSFLFLFLLSFLARGSELDLVIDLSKSSMKRQQPDIAIVDILTTIRSQRSELADKKYEITRLSFLAKNSVGGAQVYLKNNGEIVDMVVIENDPDSYASGPKRFVLKNIDRGFAWNSEFIVSGINQVAISSMTVSVAGVEDGILNPPPMEQRPEPEVIPPVTVPPVVRRTPPVVVPQAPPPRVETVPRVRRTEAAPPRKPAKCIEDRNGNIFCIGQQVYNRYNQPGTVMEIRGSELGIQFRYEDNITFRLPEDIYLRPNSRD